MKQSTYLTLLLFLLPIGMKAQIGGRHAFDFVNIPVSARTLALGSINVSTQDEDLMMAIDNPALLNEDMHNRVGISLSPYVGGIFHEYVGYARHFEGVGTFHSAVQVINYGEMTEADATGQVLGSFSANEFAWVVGYSRKQGIFRYGANMKLLISQLAPGFSASGIAMDFGAAYRSKSELFHAGISVQNLGVQLTNYTASGERYPLPFQVVAGVSNKLKYMPLRFSITATNLEQPILIYQDPNPQPVIDPFTGEEIQPENTFFDNLFRHFVFGTEFLLGNALRLRAGYNYMRRQELRPENRGGFTGFSLGVGVNSRRVAFNYGYASYGIGNAFNSHQFSAIINLSKPEAE
ncbi:type IX secretion system protein PorQ [Pontibacter sp. G13]|uniref:type IX secretion system protein PorQ n=1 Tax=Pontibacter sp. G13 TaxID=3074898 RepID=UPI002889BC24|nr:type IX secretion system protein PorQ [Pontibacter sp. G13]WNJ21513.1 type IX secretion system protein PorQ [Pontibacter sp. G13]